MQTLNTTVLIIGGGVTGTGLARDLSMRGIACILVEKNDINAGASGGNHGLLHSGARYIASDPEAAIECHQENMLLKILAPHCIEDTGGLFVAFQGDDEAYIADFGHMCSKNGIPATPLDVKDVLEIEPALSSKMIAAFAVQDATIDPFRLSLDNLAHAKRLGSHSLRHTRIVGFETQHGNITVCHAENTQTGAKTDIHADIIVNAAGAWALGVAKMAGIELAVLYSKGSLLVTQDRMTSHVINRLRQAADADIIVPGGTVSILGTTSLRVSSPDNIFPEIDEVDYIIEESAVMAPSLLHTRYIRAYCGVRPLFSACEPESDNDDRCVSRGFQLIDHSQDGMDNFITITGGKLTTYRLMAEKTADLVCQKLNVDAHCRTHVTPLTSTVTTRWTEPGLAPLEWLKQNDPTDILLCECEMVPQTIIDDIANTLRSQNSAVTLKTIGLRSRIGKGPCQGTFCSQRIAAYLYDTEFFTDDAGLDSLKAFLHERWRGQHPLLWDVPLIQAELQEALHCGFFSLELS